ncbi:MAG TPA: haloacid dehalogenase-like hydrolase [Solirubrobacteraceae bacterium]
MLLLFDIDGTLLLKASGAHAQAVHEALHEVYGVVEPPKVEAAGRTDYEIARHICLLSGVSAERFDLGRADFRLACVAAYARLAPDDLSAHVSPGMLDVLEALATRNGTRLGILTGNLEPIAHLKLVRAHLARFFEPWVGGFGSDHEDRTELPAIARRRAGGYPRSKTVVIGDTPRDIACARADGVRCVAVATGPFAVKELGEADVVVRSAHELLDVL